MLPLMNGMLPLMEMVCYHLWKWYVTAYGNGMLPLMKWYVTAYEMVCYRLCNLNKLPNTVCNRFRQPLMETEGNCLGNRLWEWKELSEQPLMEMEEDCLSKRL
jgi:hypothetical protein